MRPPNIAAAGSSRCSPRPRRRADRRRRPVAADPGRVRGRWRAAATGGGATARDARTVISPAARCSRRSASARSTSATATSSAPGVDGHGAGAVAAELVEAARRDMRGEGFGADGPHLRSRSSTRTGVAPCGRRRGRGSGAPGLPGLTGRRCAYGCRQPARWPSLASPRAWRRPRASAAPRGAAERTWLQDGPRRVPVYGRERLQAGPVRARTVPRRVHGDAPTSSPTGYDCRGPCGTSAVS